MDLPVIMLVSMVTMGNIIVMVVVMVTLVVTLVLVMVVTLVVTLVVRMTVLVLMVVVVVMAAILLLAQHIHPHSRQYTSGNTQQAIHIRQCITKLIRDTSEDTSHLPSHQRHTDVFHLPSHAMPFE